MAPGGPISLLVMGSGLYVYTFQERNVHLNNTTFDLGTQLYVFEQTGTYVRGLEDLSNGESNVISRLSTGLMWRFLTYL